MGLPGCGIPENKLPQCWNDDVRMNALFAPFRLKTVNPESWDMKMKFWSDMLRQWCRCKKDPIVSAADARYAFQRRGRSPACIDIVVEEMYRNGDLSPISKYQQILHNGPEGWVKWTARLAFKPAAFALTAVTSLLPSRQSLDGDGLPKASIDSTQRFVLESVLKEQATDFLQNYPPGEDRIGTIDELMKNVDWQQGRETFELMLGWLVYQGSAIKKDDIVKLADLEKKVAPITEGEEAMVKLSNAEARLEADSTRLTKDLTAVETEARAAAKLGNRVMAKNHLRRKHKIQQRLDRCTATLDNVRQLLQQMKDVHVNAAIVDTYKTSSEAMKKGMSSAGLTEDTVHDTMDDLKEVMESYNEVEKAIGGTIEDYDTAELEEELKELLSGPPPSGGTPGKEEKASKQPQTRPTGRKISERDFIFDGEERMLAELNDLDIEDASPEKEKKKEEEKEIKKKDKAAVSEHWEGQDDLKPSELKPSKPWYPPLSATLTESTWGNNNHENYGELRQDDRLHPGQPLSMEYSSPPRLYNTDFQVRDHQMRNGVWVFNTDDLNSNHENTAQHKSTKSPEKVSANFEMAPGGERIKNDNTKSEDNSVTELERRLKNLRGFKL